MKVSSQEVRRKVKLELVSTQVKKRRLPYVAGGISHVFFVSSVEPPMKAVLMSSQVEIPLPLVVRFFFS